MSSRTGSGSDAGGASVIHDLGYRGYDGPRRSTFAIARTLYVTGLLHAFGLKRSGRSKVLPFALLGFNLVPAAVLVGVVALTKIEPPVHYPDYASLTQVLSSIFAAAQAPVLFSRDLRHGSIVLYLARPLRSALLAVTRWLSLTSAIAIFLLAPVLLLWIGSLLARHDAAEHSAAAGKAALAALLLAAVLASVTGLISAWSTRRGFAVVASIAVLVLGGGVVSIVQFLAIDVGSSLVGQAAGLLSPYSLYAGIAHALDSAAQAVTPPTGLGVLAYVGVALGVPAACLALLVQRFRRAAR